MSTEEVKDSDSEPGENPEVPGDEEKEDASPTGSTQKLESEPKLGADSETGVAEPGEEKDTELGLEELLGLGDGDKDDEEEKDEGAKIEGLEDEGKSEIGEGKSEIGDKSVDEDKGVLGDLSEEEDDKLTEFPGEDGEELKLPIYSWGRYGEEEEEEFDLEEGKSGPQIGKLDFLEDEEDGHDVDVGASSGASTDPHADEEEESEEIDIYEESSEEEVGEDDEEHRDEWRPSKKIITWKPSEEGEEELEEEEEGDLISGPELSGICTVPEDVIEFYHSFAFDCCRHYNLCVPDPDTVIFASGNYIHFFDVPSRTVTFRRSAKGGGLGHIVTTLGMDYIYFLNNKINSSVQKNPKYPHIAVGEKGIKPYIVIYDWPSMEPVVVLRRGTQNGYASLHYSPDGEYLCSQGKEDDYNLTVWRWKKGRILRQQKAYGQDVLNAMFSHYNPGNITTSGFAHIKFWKLAKTFTGMKLMGSIGRFGKTEMCDIIGFVALPDEQVISGCEWGNMLIWDEGLVKGEVCRKGGMPCHDGYISQLLFDDINSEVITVGTDGFVRAWDYKLIEKADLTEEDNKIVIEALHTLEVGKDDNKSQLRYIEKLDNDPKNTKWYAQDANGGIWLLDLDQDHAQIPEKIFTCHAGGIRSVATCPNEHYVATFGDDGKIIFYNYLTKKLVLSHKFAALGGFMVWPPLAIDSSGCVLICGGADGMIRVIVVALAKREAEGEDGNDREFIRLVQTTKPHTMRINYMVINEPFKILITGSEDATIFVYQIVKRSDYISLNPIGFVRMNSEVLHITCKESRKATILVSCKGGEAVEMDVPDIPELYTKISYELTSVEKRPIVFQSVKSQIRRDLFLEDLARKKEEKVEMKKEKLKEMKKENPHLKIDEDLYLEDSDSEISLESLYFPPVPNAILFSTYLYEDVMWLSPGGYDSGYIYEYKIGIEEPFRCTMITDADDIEVHSFIYDIEKKYIFLGMQNGKIRIAKIKESKRRDLSDYWELAVHDNDNGIIPQMCFSYDNKYFFSCGRDGNLFAFTVTSEIDKPPVDVPRKPMPPWPKDELEDIADEETFSLEQLKIKAEHDKKMKLANEHKEEVLKELKNLKEKYAKLVKKNAELPIKIQVPDGEFIIDHRIEDDLDNELQDILDLEKRKIAFEAEKCGLLLDKIENYFYNCLESPIVYVHAIRNPQLRAYSFRHRVLPNEFHDAKHFVQQKIKTGRKTDSQTARKPVRSVSTGETTKPLPLGTWLKGLSSVGTNVKMNLRLQRMLLKYYERKRRMELRKEQWIRMMKTKPDPNVSHPADLAAIEHAEKTIGDYKLKTDPEFTTSGQKRVTMDMKFKQILDTRKKIYDMQKEYGLKIFELRTKKESLLVHINDLRKQLKRRHLELPEEEIKYPPEFPEFPWKKEYPEDELRLKEEDILAEYPRIILEREQEGEESEEEIRNDEYFESDDTGSQPLMERRETVSSPESSEDSQLDSDYEILLSDGAEPAMIDEEMRNLSLRPENIKLLDEIFMVDQFVSDVDLERFLADIEDSIDTLWEQEMRYKRLCRSLYTQDQIIAEINDKVDEYDNDVLMAKNERYRIAVDVKFGELRLIKLHQEIIILKDFEAHEDVLQAKVTRTENNIADELVKISDLEENIQERVVEIENLHVKEKQLLAIFNETIEDNSYADFLKKVYKKKYKPPKEKKGEDESSSESSMSTTSSSEDDESYDSQDLGIIKLDESICPPDLDRDIYDMTFKLRGERHKVEIQETEEKKMIEINKKEIEIIHKKIKNLERDLSTQQEELKEFQREKQNRLNEVMCTVTLKASQLQFFDEPGASLFNIQNKLVFSNRVLDDLTVRVGELHKETISQRKKFKLYKKHYFRMGVDCKEMQHIINHLKIDIEDTLVKKFGSIIKVDELEDIILQRLIQEMKSPLNELTEEFYRVANILKNEIRKKQNELTVLCVQNTEKMNVLAILETERDMLGHLLKKNEELKLRVNYKDLFSSSAELKRLYRLMRSQKERILRLKGEILAFVSKEKPPPVPICTPSKYALELKEALYDESPCRDVESVTTDEEDDDMFLYMEDDRAMDLLAARESLEEEEFMTVPEDIIEELLRRVPPPSASDSDRDDAVEKMLDDVIEELLNKIPPTDTAVSIFDEVLELLLARLDGGKDSEGLRKALWDIVVDMRSMQATPKEVREIFEMVFRHMKERETRVSGALDARAILYDILRKCLGLVLGRRFMLSTEEALMKVLGAMSEDETHALIDDVIRALEEYLDNCDNLHVKDVLEEVIHDLESLVDHDTPQQIFKSVCGKLRERTGPEKAMALARHAFHDALKKAMGIVTETENPLWERESFDADKAVILLLLKLHRHTPPEPIYDEMNMQLEWRDTEVDTPGTQLVIDLVQEEAESSPPHTMDAMLKRINRLLRDMRHASPPQHDLNIAYAVLYDIVRRSINFNFPDVNTENIHRALDGAAASMGLLDRIPPKGDHKPLLDEIIDRISHSLKTLLLSDGVQKLLSNIQKELKDKKDKASDIKNVCAELFEEQKAKDFKRKDIITGFRLIYDIIKYSLDDTYPNINLEDDEDVVKGVQAVLRIVDLVLPEFNKRVLEELKSELITWTAKRSDPEEVEKKVSLMIENLTELPQGHERLRRTFSYIFKLIHRYDSTKNLTLRLLPLLRFSLKAAVRIAAPNVVLEEDICHFNPDDTLLAMMVKVPISLYTSRLCSLIRSEMNRMVDESAKITHDIKKLFEFVDEYLEQVNEGEPDIYGPMEDALEDLKSFDVPTLENVYGRIYLNYIVRRSMSAAVPRVDIKEAACSIDKERPTMLLMHKIPRVDSATVELWEELLEELQARMETIEDQPEVRKMIRHAIVELTLVEPSDPIHVIHIIHNTYVGLKGESVGLLELLTGKNIFFEALRAAIEHCFPLLDVDDSNVIDKELPIIQMLAQLPIISNYRPLVEALINELRIEETQLSDAPERELVAAFIEELQRVPLHTGDLSHVYPCYAKIRNMEWPVRVFKNFKEEVYACIKRGILNVFPNLSLQDNQSAWESEEALLISSLALPLTDDPSPLIDEVRERLAELRNTMLLTDNVKRLIQEVEHHLSAMPIETGNFEYIVTCMLSVLNERSGRHLDIARIRAIMYNVMRDAIVVIAEQCDVRGQVRMARPPTPDD